MSKRVASTRMAWEAISNGLDERQRTRNAIDALARQHGIVSRYGRTRVKRTRRTVRADERPGECRTLDAAEIAALGYDPS